MFLCRELPLAYMGFQFEGSSGGDKVSRPQFDHLIGGKRFQRRSKAKMDLS